ncbi:pilus assembly protein [Novosphingobium sp.]|uniref:TadE/TadG family type IV pilus assembly protein n=1 Tax=Novosphingobium sp. TaxID=1874826 RepID=UPI00286BBA54|nr:pilus assembly protein [Novosphingobium sp.]
MQRSPIIRFARDQAGATAATYALSLSALIVIAGVGFDYGRLAAMDSELQNGADQAALAGATQLDGNANACQRAATQAINLVTNKTIVANSANTITIANEAACDATGNVRFYQDKNGATAATTDANARFISVLVDARTANYAFTPITGLLIGSSQAAAMAGLGSSICKVPPVFMCNPKQSSDPTFTTADYIGKGIRLTVNDGGAPYGSGQFGYLQNNGGNGVPAIKEALGRVDPPGDCISVDSIQTKTGAQVTVLDALNTRFDLYTGDINATCNADGSLCPPSDNSRKDVVHKGGTNNCAFTNGNGNGWQVSTNPYIAPTTSGVARNMTAGEMANLSPMGYPRDLCHAWSATGNCGDGRVGSGAWDRAAYFKSNPNAYGTGTFDYTTALGTATPSRYQVYRYEAANSGTRLVNEGGTGGGSSGGASSGGGGGATGTSRPKPYCRTPGIPVGTAQIDRRVLSVAIVNCDGANLNNPVQPIKFVDVFLTEPAVRRSTGGGTLITEGSDVYIEVVGATTLGGGTSAAQLVRRDVPYLVK